MPTHNTPPQAAKTSGLHAAAKRLWALTLALPMAATAGTFDASILGSLDLDRGVPIATFTTLDAPGITLTASATAPATLTSSDIFGSVGLWLGLNGSGGRYSLSLNVPVVSMSFSFIALSTLSGESETLSNFVTDSLTQRSFVSSAAPNAATWDEFTVTPSAEDSRGVLTFTSQTLAGFSSILFDHIQMSNLQGFVINQVDYTLAPVPEPASVALMAAGLVGLLGLQRKKPRRTS